MDSGRILFLCLLGLSLVLGDEVDVVFRRNADGPLQLNCTLPHQAIWLKNGTKIEPSNHIRYVFENGINTLVIEKAVKASEVIGTYSCQSVEKGAEKSIEIRVSMEPHVTKFTSSSNVVEGDKLKVTCAVVGSPLPTVKWQENKDGDDLWADLVLDDRIQLEEANDIPNSVLVINNAQEDDRGDYMCIAENPLGSSNSTVLIRVIDKYAALWPFLGICVEVIVLCAVIFLFEKRRTKKLEESENEQNNSKHVVNAKDSEVRNRK